MLVPKLPTALASAPKTSCFCTFGEGVQIVLRCHNFAPGIHRGDNINMPTVSELGTHVNLLDQVNAGHILTA